MSTSATSQLANIFNDVSYEASKAKSTRGTSNLDQDDFLKLLTTQLEHQDPMSPMDDTDFIAQMANFTSLEQTKTMSSTLQGMATAQQTLGLTSYLGKNVTLKDGDDTVTGEVSAITSNANSLFVVVNGKEYLPNAITSVSQTATTNSTNQTQE